MYRWPLPHLLCYADRGGAVHGKCYNFFLLFISAHLFEFKELRLTNSQRYNPDLQRRSLENRKEKQENFNEWVTQLKKHSKSDLPRKFICSLLFFFPFAFQPSNLGSRVSRSNYPPYFFDLIATTVCLSYPLSMLPLSILLLSTFCPLLLELPTTRRLTIIYSLDSLGQGIRAEPPSRYLQNDRGAEDRRWRAAGRVDEQLPRGRSGDR